MAATDITVGADATPSASSHGQDLKKTDTLRAIGVNAQPAQEPELEQESPRVSHHQPKAQAVGLT